FPASWFQSLNPIYIILLAPFFSWLWIYLARRNLEPSTPFKFALAMFQLALGFLVMFGAASLLASEAGDNKVLPFWLLFTYLFHTTAELCLSPVGLSSVTKLAPQRYASQMMGTWFMGTALGNLIAGLLAGFLATESESLESMPDKFLILIMYYAAAGVLFAVMIKPLKWLAGRRVQPQHSGQ
ncbi:MAG TPA: MFS transporter, partial [Gammaproteobacteria bacterium]|nr:MFS transporter [Gammaproteobacteria bacterium]